ncbi:hypothetical protein, partial [Aeromonas salmonicida]|uniref:hypothetical protein n=1 Tax=Aeromonas salmonicida TaxID=645 RepID=UPI0031D028D8
RGMVVLRSLGFQLVPFKLHRFRKQRRSGPSTSWHSCSCLPVSMSIRMPIWWLPAYCPGVTRCSLP